MPKFLNFINANAFCKNISIFSSLSFMSNSALFLLLLLVEFCYIFYCFFLSSGRVTFGADCRSADMLWMTSSIQSKTKKKVLQRFFAPIKCETNRIISSYGILLFNVDTKLFSVFHLEKSLSIQIQVTAEKCIYTFCFSIVLYKVDKYSMPLSYRALSSCRLAKK